MKKFLLSLATISALLGDDFDDFGAMDDLMEETKVEKVKVSPFSLTGRFVLSSAYNTQNDLEGITSSKLLIDTTAEYQYLENHKAKLQLVGYYDPIYFIRDDIYTTMPDTYDQELEIGEAYFQGKIIDGVDYTIGRQVVSWGKSDNIRIVDMLNPLDFRQPAITDFKNIKLPVGMAKIDWYFGDYKLSVIDIFEQRFMKFPEYGSGYISINLPDITTPDYEQQYALSLDGRFSGWDASLYAGHNYYDGFYAGYNPTSLNVDMVDMIGAAAAFNIEPFIIKMETAYIAGVKLNSSVDEKDVVRALVGIETIIPDGSVSFELSDSYIRDYDDALNTAPFNLAENTPSYALRYSQSFLHELLSLNYVASLQGLEGEYGGYMRAWGDYDITDALQAELGYVVYIGGENYLFEAMKDNDKVFASLSYSY